MKINSTIDALIFNRTKKRKKAQDDLTAQCVYGLSDSNLKPTAFHYESSEEDNGYYHLLSEGVISDTDGYPYQIIGKGVIKDWYESLDPTMVYNIDLQHDDRNPIFRQIGTWSKSDLQLREMEDGRTRLYVKLNLDEDSIVVKELRRKDIPLGLSAEFYSDGSYVDFTYEMDGEAQTNEIYCHKEIDIVGFALVDEPQDAHSGNISLNAKEDNSLKNTSFLNALKQAFGTPDTEEVVETETVEETEEVVEEVEEKKEVEQLGLQDEEENKETEEVEETTESEENVMAVKVDLSELKDIFHLIGETLEEQDKSQKELLAKVEELEEKVSKMNTFSISDNAKIEKPTTNRVGF